MGTKRRGEGILRMEDTGTLEEDDIDSQDSNTPIDHGHLARNCLIKIKWSFAQMCCAMSLVCPSIATHRTCQFWAHNEPINMPKTIEPPTKCGGHAVIQFLYSAQATRNVVLLHDNTRPHTAAATKRLVKRFQWEVFGHPLSSVWTWFPVIFISFLVWNGCRRTTFWHNELQISIENWLKAQAAGFYDEGTGKLVSHYEKCLRRSDDYVEK